MRERRAEDAVSARKSEGEFIGEWRIMIRC